MYYKNNFIKKQESIHFFFLKSFYVSYLQSNLLYPDAGHISLYDIGVVFETHFLFFLNKIPVISFCHYAVFMQFHCIAFLQTPLKFKVYVWTSCIYIYCRWIKDHYSGKRNKMSLNWNLNFLQPIKHRKRKVYSACLRTTSSFLICLFSKVWNGH